MKISFKLNEKPIDMEIAPEQSLLDLLRNDLHLTGTKCGCDTGDCGACSVLLNDALVKSCQISASRLEGHRVTTIEGIGDGAGGLSDLQKSFLDHGAIQCGFCIPAMVMAGEALLRRNPAPSREEIRGGISNVLCRCTGYQQIIDAIEDTAHQRQVGPHGFRAKKLESAQ